MTTLQKALITVSLLAAASTGIYELRQASQLREQFQASVNHVWPVLIEAIQRRVQEV